MDLLLPVYRPGSALLDLLRAGVPFDRVLIVDDGTGPSPVLDEAATLGATVLRHDTNRGKGEALKTGFRHLAGSDVVAADADGQHSLADIEKVATRLGTTGRLVLGVRRVGREMPLRSRFGNALTQMLFEAATGRPVRDTQTGLRGYPSSLLEWLLTVPGERFEYEMNVLLHAARAGHPIEQVEIATTYLDGNASSHFGAVSDAVRIYRPLLRYALRSASGVPHRHENGGEKQEHADEKLDGVRPGVAAGGAHGAFGGPDVPPGGVAATEAVPDDDDGGRGQHGGDSHCGTLVVRHAEPPGDA